MDWHKGEPKHYTKVLKFYLTGNRESLKNSRWVIITIVAVWIWPGRHEEQREQ